MLNLTKKSDAEKLMVDRKKKAQKVIKKNKTRGRALYETEADLDNEAEVVEALSHTLKAAFDKMPMSYGLDYFVTKKNKAVEVTEVKCRKISHDAYPTYMLSLLKWNKGLDFHNKNGLRFSLVVKFTDGIYRYVFKEEDLDNGILYEFSGRTKTTRDSADLEPCVRIPMNMFQKVPIRKEKGDTDA